MTKTAVIMGHNGRFGGAVAPALADAGWRLRIYRRGQDDLTQMAQGADVIVMGAHPPYYHLWAAQMPALHHAVQQAALASGALVLFPGNVYVYGAGSGPLWTSDTPHAATNPLGRLRVEVEGSYARAGVRTLILRAGDYLDTKPSGNWFDRFMTPGLAKGVFRYPGRTDVPHAWAYLPDLGRAAAGLLDDPARYDGVTEVPRLHPDRGRDGGGAGPCDGPRCGAAAVSMVAGAVASAIYARLGRGAGNALSLGYAAPDGRGGAGAGAAGV